MLLGLIQKIRKNVVILVMMEEGILEGSLKLTRPPFSVVILVMMEEGILAYLELAVQHEGKAS